MKHFIQFKQLSTGYISGTIPPQFSKDNIKAIDTYGSFLIFFGEKFNTTKIINKQIYF